MPVLQETIHKLEVAGGLRYVKLGLTIVGLVLVTCWYNARSYKNMATQEAMDSAQLARNISQGKGYTTFFVRPFSMYLLRKHNEARIASLTETQRADLYQIKGPHPDIANPPVYPLLLAGLLKLGHFDYTVSNTKAFWANGGHFWRYPADFFISIFNQLLFFGVIALVFLLARRLFDPSVAWVTAGILFGTELFWRFSVSDLSTMLLLLLFTGLVWCLFLFDESAREQRGGIVRLLVLAGIAGALVGVGALTRYSFAFAIIPVLLFLLLFGGSQRFLFVACALLLFACIFTPWVVRNFRVSGTPFGTAGYAVYENSAIFPGHSLERTLEPDFQRSPLVPFTQKLLAGTRQILADELPRLTGNWLGAFFLVGLLVGLTHPGASRLRYFVLLCLPIFILVQAGGRTQLSEDSPVINSENLLVLLAPFVLLFGVSFFFLLLNQIFLPIRELRYLILGLFCAIGCLPMLFTFLPPKGIPVVYPPYHPFAIQTWSNWLKENEMSMSDVPWAAAWYGQRESVWMTQTLQPEFFNINDYQKQISILYLTRLTTDRRFASQWLTGPEQTWGVFILDCITRNQVPAYFPLRKTQAGWLPDQMVLCDWERWRKTEPGTESSSPGPSATEGEPGLR
jgi:hypothetical protein